MKSIKAIIPAIILAVLLCGCSSTYSSYEKPHTQSADTVFASSETTQEPSITQQPEPVELPPQLEIAIEDIYQANRRENLLNNGSVFHVSVLLADHTQQIDFYYTQDAYFEEQTVYWKAATTKQLILYTESETCQTTVFNRGEKEFSIIAFFMPIEPNINEIRGSLDDYHPVREAMLREKIIAAGESGNYIEVETEFLLESTEDCQLLRLPSDKVGCVCCYVYRLNRDTLVISERREYLRSPDGNEELYSISTSEYLPELPNNQVEMLTRLNGQGQNDPRTITVIYDPDTDRETSFSMTVDAGTIVHYYFLPYELFCDKNGLEPLTQIPQEGDVIIYGLPEKQETS